MSAKHTPGPWYEGSTGNHQGLINSEATGQTVAICYDKKDAPLVSAAPELLEALKAALATHQIRHDIAVRVGIQPPSKEAWVESAHSAISKAEGRT